jgi:hypothetical protein
MLSAPFAERMGSYDRRPTAFFSFLIPSVARDLLFTLLRFYFLTLFFYSYRSATSGSTDAARCAGTQHATSPVISNNIGTRISVHGS